MGGGGSVAGRRCKAARARPRARNRWATGDRSRGEETCLHGSVVKARNRWARGDRSLGVDRHGQGVLMSPRNRWAMGDRSRGAWRPPAGPGGPLAIDGRWGIGRGHAEQGGAGASRPLAIDGRWGIGRGVRAARARRRGRGARNRWAMGDRSRALDVEFARLEVDLAIDGRRGIGRGVAGTEGAPTGAEERPTWAREQVFTWGSTSRPTGWAASHTTDTRCPRGSRAPRARRCGAAPSRRCCWPATTRHYRSMVGPGPGPTAI